jgi:glycosyltransferase involved in cell wall biosynthesis
MRVLVVAHGHPDLAIGGGETAAYRQVEELRRRGVEVLFLARAPTPSARGGTPFSVHPTKPHDILFHSPDFDPFLLSQKAKWAIYDDYAQLLQKFKPDIVHFHHYYYFGLEIIRETRKYSSALPIVFTLHEYLAICHHLGQMVKTDRRLCARSSSLECHQCFPQYSPQDFFLRERFIKSFFALVDSFVAPSRFLAERYVSWGLDRERIALIENGQPSTGEAPAAMPADAARLSRRFGFFGAVSELKGILVLLDAAARLPQQLRDDMRIAIHGTLHNESNAFVAEFEAAVRRAGLHVRFSGPYRTDDLPALMRNIGWVVVPSIWWENSPLVIQEAFDHRRPVICSDIGGMAEKVRDRVDGLYFRTADAIDLADRIAEAADPELWERLRQNIRPPPTIAATTDEQLALYGELLAARTPTAVIEKPKRRTARA